MATSQELRLLAAAVVLLSGCSGTGEPLNDLGPLDEGRSDAGLLDSGPVDSGRDAGGVDASPILRIVSMDVPPAEVGQAYTATVTASAPASWAITENVLPNDLQLVGGTSPTIGIRGRAFVTGQFTIQLTATAADGSQASLQLSINVLGSPPPPITITPTTAPDALSGAAYDHTFEAVGGFSPVVWSVASLPPGLGASQLGRILTVTGTPTQAANTVIGLDLSDASGTSSSSQVRLTVRDPTLALADQRLPAAQRGTLYSAQVSASGGRVPYVWTVVGTLPAGLSVTHAGATTTIEGTPNNQGDYTFGLAVQSGPERVQASLSVGVFEPLGVGGPGNLQAEACGPVSPNVLSISNPPGGPVHWSIVSGPDGAMIRYEPIAQSAEVVGHVRPPMTDVVVEARQGDRYGLLTIPMTDITAGGLDEAPTQYLAVTTGSTTATSLHLIDVCSSSNPQATLLTSQLTHPSAYKFSPDRFSLVYMVGPPDEAELWAVPLQQGASTRPVGIPYRLVASPGPGQGVRDFVISPNSSRFVAFSADLAIDDIFEAWIANVPTPFRVHPPLTAAHQGVAQGSLRYRRFGSSFFFVGDVESPGDRGLYFGGGQNGLHRVGNAPVTTAVVHVHPSQDEALIVADPTQTGVMQLHHFRSFGGAETLTTITSTAWMASPDHVAFVGDDAFFVARSPATSGNNLFKWNQLSPTVVVGPMVALGRTEDVTRIRSAPDNQTVAAEVTDRVPGILRLVDGRPWDATVQPTSAASNVAPDWSIGCSGALAFVDLSSPHFIATYETPGGLAPLCGSTEARASSVFYVRDAYPCSDRFTVASGDICGASTGVGLVDQDGRNVSDLAAEVVPGPTHRAIRSTGHGIFYVSNENGRQILYSADIRLFPSPFHAVTVSHDVGSLLGLNVLTVEAEPVR